MHISQSLYSIKSPVLRAAFLALKGIILDTQLFNDKSSGKLRRYRVQRIKLWDRFRNRFCARGISGLLRGAKSQSEAIGIYGVTLDGLAF